jgi:hypothetical protein
MTAGQCPGCGLSDRSHEVLAECWTALEEQGLLVARWREAPDDPARIGSDLPTARTLRWLRERGNGVWPLCGPPPESVSVPPPGADGFYAATDAVDAARRRFHCGPIADATVVERLAAVDEWIAVRRSCRPETLVRKAVLSGRVDPDVRVFELTDTPSGRDPAALAADRFLLQRTGTQFGDVLFAHDGWTGERVGRAPEPADVPSGVERRLRAEIATEML